jgi:hypothetical protein
MATGTILPDGDLVTTNWALSAAASFWSASSDGNIATYGYTQTTGAMLVMSLADITFPGGHGLQSLTAQAQLSVDAGMAGRLVLLDASNNVLATSGVVSGANVVTSCVYTPSTIIAAATANTIRIGVVADTAAVSQFVRVMDQTQASYVTAPAVNYFVKGII